MAQTHPMRRSKWRSLTWIDISVVLWLTNRCGNVVDCYLAAITALSVHGSEMSFPIQLNSSASISVSYATDEVNEYPLTQRSYRDLCSSHAVHV
ncbi:hypothetical protein TNCV_1969321 [Trichonephila clavipes]|nr:hypothetical protein TNCV_1969321 [Trichonephila clavipes]